MTELANKDIKTPIITTVDDVKVNMNIVREMQIENVTNKVKNFIGWYS